MNKKNIFILSFLFVLIMALTFSLVSATANPTDTTNLKGTSSKKGSGFGGKILDTEIKNVTCIDGGVPLVLSSNIGGLIDAVASSVDQQNTTGGKIIGGASGLYRAIPFFVFPTAKGGSPQKSGFILGTAEIAPNFNYCSIKDDKSKKGIPFPVREVVKYGSSKPK